MENNKDLIGYTMKPIDLKSTNIGDILEISFNIGGIFCPISSLLGLGIGAYNKKLAQDNLDYLVYNLNNLIHNQNFLINKVKQLEKRNKELSNAIEKCSNQIDSTNQVINSQEEILINIKNKTDEEIRNFSFNLQKIVNKTIQEKSKNKIQKYSEYIVKTILDDVIFNSNNNFDYVLNVISSLTQNDKDVLDFMYKQKDNVYDTQFSNTYKNKEYAVEIDDFLSLQKLIKLGLVDFDTELIIPHKDYMLEGMCRDLDKYYYLTSFYYHIRDYISEK